MFIQVVNSILLIHSSCRKHKKHKKHKDSDDESSDDDEIRSDVKVTENSQTVAVNGDSSKDVVISIDENSSEASECEMKEKDSDCEINLEVLEDEMNLEELMKQKVCSLSLARVH